MRRLSVLEETAQLIVLIEQCVTRAAMAKQQAKNYAHHYRANAEEFRKQAARSRFPEIKVWLLRIAASNERLSKIVEGTDDKPETHDQTHRWEPIEVSARGLAAQRVEDPVAQARRHVAEAEGRIERQEALVARLSGSARYTVFVGEAREILATLKQTLQLARDHLALELKK